jgi:hypothetical protein
VTGINPADWYLVDGAFPPFPEQGAAAPPAGAGVGGIAGTLMYPSSGIPAMRIVAFQKGSNAHFFVDTILGQSISIEISSGITTWLPTSKQAAATPAAGGYCKWCHALKYGQ